MAKMLNTVLFILIFFCVNGEPINETNENYTPHIWGILNYFNTDPNRIYNYNVGVLENAQKTEKGLFLQIEVQVECRLNPNDPRCGPKVHTCEAFIEKIEGIDRYEILPGAICHPKYEPTERGELNGEVPVQRSSVLQVNEEPTSSVQASNEASPSGEISDEFVAVRRNSNQCLGCVIDLDKNVEGLPDLITTALKHLESERENKHVLLNVLRVQQQVVAGIKYILLLEVAPTVCAKDVNTVTPELCPLNTNVPSQICHITYWQKPWISLQKHIIANNCTVSQEFTDTTNPTFPNTPKRRYPEDIDNEIEITNAYGNRYPSKIIDKEPNNVPNFDEIANSGRFDIENSDFISPSALANIESQIEFHKTPKQVQSVENENTAKPQSSEGPAESPSGEVQVQQIDSIPNNNGEVISNNSSTSSALKLEDVQTQLRESTIPVDHQRRKRSPAGSTKTSFKKSNPYNKQWLRMLAKFVVEEKLGPNRCDVVEVLYPKQQKNEKLGGVVYSFLINLKKSKSEEMESCKTKVLIPNDKSEREILKFKCYDNKNKGNKKLSRVPRQIPGGVWDVSVSDPIINDLAHSSLMQLNLQSSRPNRLKVIEIISAQKQVVAGLLYHIKTKVVSTECSPNDLQDSHQCIELVGEGPSICEITIWDRPWIHDGREVNITCDDDQVQHSFKTSSVRHKEKRSIESNKNEHNSLKYEDLFDHFVITFSKNYADEKEYNYRFNVFKENMKYVHLLNKYEQGTGRYGITMFADLTQDEFRKYKGFRIDLKNHNEVGNSWAEIPNTVELPIEFDWRTKGAVTEVKNQGTCGSCWAFSVTGNVEGQFAIKNGKLLEFSEQELVDCDTIDEGCNGGLMDNAYRSIEKLGGLETESDYPYEGEQEKCHFRSSLTKVKVSGAVNISTNETDMAKWLVKNGPISIAINANAMQFYLGGVSHPWKFLCDPKSLDHGVLIVGYGMHKYPYLKKTLPYWIVKNSWGKSWGEQGYYLVYRGDGTCGLNQTPSSAIVE
ncbi:uncharacterized protein LOC108736406 [Agrilus planipennis]|uniref:Uncharacterized protein LOC108736406 n=1 Tax=Agrilus planipennis TaxID=224129 RepID=A0A1W4WK57_AGRPL|nr:uncharacterized protein LOC108736406 [Agrilus planipennis]